jgi:hypothetical protein
MLSSAPGTAWRYTWIPRCIESADTDCEGGTTAGVEAGAACRAAGDTRPALALAPRGSADGGGAGADVVLLTSDEAVRSGDRRTATTTTAAPTTRARRTAVVTRPDNRRRDRSGPGDGGMVAWLDMTGFSELRRRPLAIKARRANVVTLPDNRPRDRAGRRDSGIVGRRCMSTSSTQGRQDSPSPPEARRPEGAQNPRDFTVRPRFGPRRPDERRARR